MYHLRRVFAFLAAVGFVLAMVGHSQAQIASAASVKLAATGVQHTRQNRGNNLLNTQINYDDCHLGDTIKFSLSLAGYSGYTLQTWAGSGCDNITYRTTTNTLQCWQIGPNLSPSSINPPAIELSVKDILYGRTKASGTSTGVSAGTAGTGGDGTAGTGGDSGAGAGAGGAATAGSAGAAASTDDVACSDKGAVTTPQTITLYFMLVDSANAIQGTFATFIATYKLLAPAPPDTVSAGIGEGLLPITFGYNGSTSDNTINGYNFYCDPPPGTDAAADAGVLPDDAGVLIVPACVGSTKLIQGAHPDEMYRCGKTGGKATKGNATGLINGVAYNVAVATTDSYGNTGVLSKTVCEVPQPVTGFFEAYRDAGGQGGGGFCAFSRHREPLPLLVLLGFASYWVMRRRRAT
jgi:hypothetical protein